MSIACEWCGRAVAQDAEGRWYAVKGEERGYDPLTCEASDDRRHAPDQPEASPATAARWSCPLCQDTGMVAVTRADNTQVIVQCSPLCVPDRAKKPPSPARGG